jgi:membrane-associated phospholipid phosphatase
MAVSHADLALIEPATRPKVTRTWAAVRAHLLAPIRGAAYLSPFLITGALYELLRGVFRRHGSVHVADLAALEARLFSVATAQGPRPLSELIARHANVWLDVWCGATYFLFLVEIVGVSVYLLFRGARSKALELSVGFLVVNLLGWLVWVCYPAAPPWYVDQYGLQSAVSDVVSSPAGLLRFDALLGVPFASAFYAKSADVFGAVPSLHVAYATLVVCVLGSLAGRLRLAALGFALSMAFSAVYLRHHYIVDVVAGALLAIVVALGMRAVRRLAARQPIAACPPRASLPGDRA